jgi:hypothetical protein
LTVREGGLKGPPSQQYGDVNKINKEGGKQWKKEEKRGSGGEEKLKKELKSGAKGEVDMEHMRKKEKETEEKQEN